MAKQLFQVEKEIGGDGAKASAGLAVAGDALELALKVTYPIAKIVEPATSVLDAQLDKLKALIPGDWDDLAIDKFKAEYKAELVKVLSEEPAA